MSSILTSTNTTSDSTPNTTSCLGGTWVQIMDGIVLTSFDLDILENLGHVLLLRRINGIYRMKLSTSWTSYSATIIKSVSPHAKPKLSLILVWQPAPDYFCYLIFRLYRCSANCCPCRGRWRRKWRLNIVNLTYLKWLFCIWVDLNSPHLYRLHIDHLLFCVWKFLWKFAGMLYTSELPRVHRMASNSSSWGSCHSNIQVTSPKNLQAYG